LESAFPQEAVMTGDIKKKIKELKRAGARSPSLGAEA